MALDGSDFKTDMGGLFGGISSITGMLDPASTAIELVGKQLGLPPAVRNAAKLGIGVVMMNPMAVASGAAGLAAEAQREEPAKTEMGAPKRDDGGQPSTQGYASTANVPPRPTYGAREAMRLDSPEVLAFVPNDPQLASSRERYVNETDPERRAAYKAAYERELKLALEANPYLRADFERQFNVKLEFGPNSGNSEIFVRRLSSPSSTAPSSDVSSFGGSSWNGSSSGVSNGSVGSGDWSPNSYTMGSGSSMEGIMGKIGGQMSSTDQKINDLKNKTGELTEKEMVELQDLMQKKNQMFTLLSTLMNIQNQMAMTAIQNMKG